jgi:hypothetical protein
MPSASLPAEQASRVEELECQAHQGRDRRERDVALGPREAHPEDTPPFMLAVAYEAPVDHGRRIGPGLRAREREAGDLAAVGEAGQVVELLRLGAEPEQQLAGAERVRHHNGDGGRHGAGRDSLDDLRVRERREAEAAVGLRDDHP